MIGRAAVERQFEIIGEAISRLIKSEPGLSLRLPESREAVQFRNFLAHGYHLVEHQLVWSIVLQDVRPLRNRVEELLIERQDQA